MSRWITLVGLLWVPIVTAADPPLPNPDNPVDYIQWANEEYGKGITENAADVYQEAIAAFELDKELLNLGFEPNPPKWSAEQRDRLHGYVDRNAKALKRYAQAARIPKCYFVITPSESGAMMDLQSPVYWGPLRSLAKLTIGRARLRLSEGDLDGAVEDAATLLRVSRHLQTQPGIMAYMLGVAIGQLAYDSVLLEIPRVTAKPVDYNEVMRALKSADRPPRRFTRQLEVELVILWDCAQRFLRDADGDGRYESASFRGDQKHVFGQPQTLDEIVRESRDYFASLKDVFVADYQKSKTRLDAIERKMAAQKGKTLTAMMAPSFRRVAELQRRFVAGRNAYRVVFHLHAYQAEHGRWPKELKEALPDRTARKLNDPFANKPFRYQLKDGQPFLYSVSINGVDDGGELCRTDDGKPKWGDTGDFVFWPHQD
ncbi:MAG: hypothetical protein KAY37_14570 [Phycisphaerae bacterium]|nr:hypothetical protein [Phycisphaerae bacterium]